MRFATFAALCVLGIAGCSQPAQQNTEKAPAETAASPAETAQVAKEAPPISTDGTDPKTWDMSKQALMIAPDNHKIIYEDDNIRVNSVTIPAGTEEPYHLHPFYSVLIVDPIAGSNNVEDRAPGGVKAPMQLADRYVAPTVMAQPPQALHSVKNKGTVDAHLIRIEFKNNAVPTFLHPDWEKTGDVPISTDGTDPKSWPAKDLAPVAAPDLHTVIFENDTLRIMSVTVPVGVEEPYHAHPYPSVLIFDTTAKAADRDRNGQSADATLPPAPVVMLQPPQGYHSVKNLGTVPVHLIRVEFKQGFPKPRVSRE